MAVADLGHLALRVASLEQVGHAEQDQGLSMREVAERLARLEGATADLRVRTVLEEQVQALALTKGDARDFTAQLSRMDGALRGLVEDLRHDAGVETAIRTISERQVVFFCYYGGKRKGGRLRFPHLSLVLPLRMPAAAAAGGWRFSAGQLPSCNGG